MRKGLYLAILSVAGVLILAATLYIVNERKASQQHKTTDETWSLIARPISQDDHVLGKVDAPVQVIVYSDLSCKFCRNFFHVQVYKLQQEFGDDIVIAYRHLPLKSRPRALAEARAAECAFQAGGQHDFWAFVRGVYSNDDYEAGLSDEQMRSIAGTLPIDLSEYDSCIASGGGNARVATDATEAIVAGLSITPSIVLKSPTRALTVQGNYYSRISAGILYLLSTSKSTEATQQM